MCVFFFPAELLLKGNKISTKLYTMESCLSSTLPSATVTINSIINEREDVIKLFINEYILPVGEK